MGQNKKRRFTRPTKEEMAKFKALLGPELTKRYTPRQLVGLYHDVRVAAKLLLDLWIEKKERGDSEGFERSHGE